jgi:hypothetical protein
MAGGPSCGGRNAASGFDDRRAWMGREPSLGVLGAYEPLDDKLPVDDISVRRDGGLDQAEPDGVRELLAEEEMLFEMLGSPASGDPDMVGRAASTLMGIRLCS